MSSPIAVVLSPCRFELDPRHGYWSLTLRNLGFHVIEVEILDEPSNWRNIGEVLISESQRFSVFSESGSISSSEGVQKVLAEVPVSTSTCAYVKKQAGRAINALHLLNGKLLDVSLVIANDLIGAIGALSYWDSTEVPVIYDAQEIFTDSYDVLNVEPFSESERAAWIGLESLVVESVSRVVTVSPGIADLYLLRHRKRPVVIPNFAPASRCLDINLSANVERKPISFVYIGRADPYRGLEQLVKEWDFDPSIATLDLIIPEGAPRTGLEAIAKNAPRSFSGPRFLPSVSPDLMVKELSKFDVGVLPYKYPPPYDQASPNKFGEYVAAGLPVIANRQPFVESLIISHRIGVVFEWGSEKSLRSAVEEMLDETVYAGCKTELARLRTSQLTWDGVFEQTQESLGINELKSGSGDTPPQIHGDAAVFVKGGLAHSVAVLLRRRILIWVKNHMATMGPIAKKLGKFKLIRAMAT